MRLQVGLLGGAQRGVGVSGEEIAGVLADHGRKRSSLAFSSMRARCSREPAPCRAPGRGPRDLLVGEASRSRSTTTIAGPRAGPRWPDAARSEARRVPRGGGVGRARRHAVQRLVVGAWMSAVAGGQAVQAQPRGDGVEPRPQARLAPELAERAVGAQECLLRDLLGLGAAAEHAQADGEHAVLIRPHQILEGRRLSAASRTSRSSLSGSGSRTVRPATGVEVPHRGAGAGCETEIIATRGMESRQPRRR